MPLRAGIGRKIALGGLLGTAATAGVARGLTDPEGTWRQDVYPTAQEIAFGNPRAVQDSMRAGLSAAMSSSPEEDVMLPGDYYYSRPVNLRGNKSTNIPVSGEIVFGMYNLRR